jgi:hypothetical protein
MWRVVLIFCVYVVNLTCFCRRIYVIACTGRFIMYCTYTGRFIMYSEITKIYYKKTVGHVFTKHVHIEGTTQKYFSPVSCFSL